MRVKFRAVLKKVDDVIIKDDFSRQRILLEIPVYDTVTGDKIRTEHFPAAILNKNIQKIDAPAMVGELCSAVCFLGSYAKEHEGETFYNLSLNCVELDKFSR